MARRNNNLLLLVGLIAVVVLFAGWMMMKNRDNNPDNKEGGSNSDIQFIEGDHVAHPSRSYSSADVSGQGADGVCDDPEFIEADPETGMNAAQLSVGTGPGVWGSPRHTSEFQNF